MAVQDDLQSLIVELDGVLSRQTGSRFSGFQPTEKALTQKVLQKIRHYLLSLQNSDSNSVPAISTLTPSERETIEQLAQIVITQIELRLTECFQPLQSELEDLRQQRQALYQDIQQLEEQRQKIITDCLEEVVTRCNEGLQQQITQGFAKLETQVLKTQSFPLPASDSISLQPQFEQLLMTLDSSLRTAFETLEKDLQTYHDSLSQGLERMHNLGQQGEAKFLAYFHRLQQQLEQSLNQGQSLETRLISPLQQPQEPIETIQLLTDLIPLNLPQPGWYLGIDWDGSNLEAVLGDAQLGENKELRILTHTLEKSANEEGYSEEYLKSAETDLTNQAVWQQLIYQLGIIFTPSQISTVKLSPEVLQEALTHLQAMIISCPSHWNEAQISHLRQAIIATKLVQLPQQISFFSPAIAVLLSHVSLREPIIKATTSLIIYSGKTSTEIALVNLPENFPTLTHSDFTLQSCNYGADYLDEDILAQIIYPQWISLLNPAFPQLDCQPRDTLKQILATYPLGWSFLKAAKLARLILQSQEAFTSTLAKQPWEVTRQAVTEKVISPFIEHLNQACTTLLNQTETPESSIQQIVYSGETLTSLDYAILPWLKDKFPQANLISDMDEERGNLVAIGLASLPLFSSLSNRQ